MDQPLPLTEPRYASLWVNIKHDRLYLVTDVAYFEEDMDPLVIYCQPAFPSVKWARRRSVFYKKFRPWDGK